MTRWIKHRDTEHKRLFPYTELENYSDCDELIMCLSERSLNIILNALESVEEMKTRVWTTRQDDLYRMVDDTQFETFQGWMSNVYNELGSWVMCNEKLERIAVALESMVQQQDEQTINLQDVFEALGFDPTEEEADILEALQYLINFPGFPSIDLKMPIGQWMASFMEGRYRSAHLQLLRDISISQRGQAVAQGGVDFAGLYDVMGETADSMLVKAGYAGKAYWLWRWLDNDQIPGWLGWLSAISAIFLGSIRNAAYDLVEAVENLDLLGIKNAIEDQTLTAIVNCNNCTSESIDDHLQPGGQPAYATVDNDSSWPDSNEPPISDDATWLEQPTGEGDYKCRSANYIVDWLQAFYGHADWNLSTGDNLITLADKFAEILASLPPIGPSLSGLSSIIGQTLAYISGGSTDIFETVNEHITDRQSDLICALYNAETAPDARQAFIDIMVEEGINALALNGLDVFLTMNNVMGILFFTPDVAAAAISLKEDNNCDCGEAIYQVNNLICGANLVSGDLSDGSTNVAESCEGNFFGTIRAGLNFAGFPDADVNRQIDFVSATYAGTCYVTLVTSGVADGGNHMSAAALSAVSGEYSGFQVVRSTASDTTPFEIEFMVSLI